MSKRYTDGTVAPAPFETIIEPFRVCSVEPIPLLSRKERVAALQRAGLNLFGLRADEVTIDLLTDSGMGAMSSAQWSAMMSGDETYAGSRSGSRFVEVVRRICGHHHVFPVHQGRGAKHILAQTVVKSGNIVISNTHCESLRANIESIGAFAVDLPIAEALIPSSQHLFKGNMDVDRLVELIDQELERVALVVLTVTNSAVGGHPVSMANLEAVRAVCRERGVPLFLDASRFAENAWLIKCREPGFDSWTVLDIVQCMFSMADGFTMSAKEDCMAHMGGVLATQNETWADRFRNSISILGGFPSSGGLAGRDLETIATGIEEAIDPKYLAYRARNVAYLAEGLARIGMTVMEPIGGHAVFIDAAAMLPHIPPNCFPAQALAVAFYEEGGVRGADAGSLMFPEAEMELFRLAIPRRTYTQAHMDYVIEAAERVMARLSTLSGLTIRSAPTAMRHFTARFARVEMAVENESLRAEFSKDDQPCCSGAKTQCHDETH